MEFSISSVSVTKEEMGIAVYNVLDDFERLNRELTDLGFTHSYNEWSFDLWTIPRVNEDGTPFK